MSNQCKHGQLARMCLTCEHEAEIERLRDTLTAIRDGLSWGCTRQHMFDIVNSALAAQRQEG